MTKKETSNKHQNNWVLLNKENKVIFYSSSIVDVIKEGGKYSIDEVSIEKKLAKGTCFF